MKKRGKQRKTEQKASRAQEAAKWAGGGSSADMTLRMEDFLPGPGGQPPSAMSSLVALTRLKQLDPAEWSVEDVATWLDFIHLSEYRPEFMKQAVGGAELVELDSQDLTMLGVTKIGHRKRIEKRIQMLKHGMAGALDYASVDDNSDASSQSSATTYSSASSTSSASSQNQMGGAFDAIPAKDKIGIKCVLNDDISVFKVSPGSTYAELARLLKKEYGARMVIRYKDKDGDEVRIRKTKHFRHALKEWNGEGTMKLYLQQKERKVSKQQADILDTMLDAVVMINSKGKVLFFNRAAERMFGYARKQVLDRNVKVLMPAPMAERHDEHIKQYMATKKGNIIGIGRRVEALHKDGHTFPMHLSVSVAKQKGKTIFTGTARMLSADEEAADEARRASSSASASSASPSADSALAAARGMFGLLDGLLDATVVIDEKGVIQFANRAACQRLGWRESELVGRNVRVLMPESIGELHDGYLKRYVETGEGTIIGIGRDVVAMKKDGEIMPVHLSVSEQQLGGGKRLFTGIMRDVEESMQRKKSLLQQEREVLDNLVVPAVIIDDRGSVHAFNKAASALLGYSLLDVVGRNVSMLMTGDDRANHDAYIQNYVRTGQSKILNKTRDVIALHKDGTLVPIALSVTVKRDGSKYIFTGVMQAK